MSNPNQFLAAVPAGLICLVMGTSWWQLRSAGSAAENQLARLRTTGPAGSEPRGNHLSALTKTTPEFAAADLPTLEAELARLDADIATVRQSVESAREETAGWLARNPVREGEFTSSFGKISDMGRDAAMAFRAMTDLLARGELEEPRDEQERKEMEEGYNKLMKLMAWGTPLAEMENTPADIAKFQATTLAEFYGLDPAAAGEVETLVAARFENMVAAGLAATDRPAEVSEADDPAAAQEFAEWRAGRTAELVALMEELRPILPEREPEVVRTVLPATLNLGLGMQSKVVPKDGDQQALVMGLPTWPTPPWLQGE